MDSEYTGSHAMCHNYRGCINDDDDDKENDDNHGDHVSLFELLNACAEKLVFSYIRFNQGS